MLFAFMGFALLTSQDLAASPGPELFQLWEQIYNEPELTLNEIHRQLAKLPADAADENTAILYAIGAEAASFAEKSEDHLRLAQAAEALAARHRYFWPWVHAVGALGVYYEYEGQDNIALQLYEKSIRLAEESQDLELLAYACNNLGYFHARNHTEKEAIEVVSRAVRAMEKLPKGVLYHDILNNLALTYTRNEFVGRMDEGRTMMERSFNYFKSRQMRYMTGNNYINLGLFYVQTREFQTAIDTFVEAIAYTRAQGKQDLLPYYLMHLGDVYNRSGRHKEALQAVEEGCPMFRRFKNTAMVADCLVTRSHAMVGLQRPADALAALKEKAELLTDASNNKNSELELEIETNAWQQLGNMPMELATYRRWRTATKKFYNQKNAQFVHQVAGLLELERKDADNKLLEEKNRTNALRLEQADRMSRILLGLLGLSLLLIGFMFFAVRQSRVIRSQRDRIQEVLDNIEEGILRFGKDFKINQDYSAHVSQILGITHDLTGHDLFEILFAQAELGADVQATIRAALSHILDEDELAWSLNSNQLPTELQRQGRILNLLWQPHHNGQGKIDKMLLVMRDVTISKALEAEVHASRQQSQIMTSFVQELLQANRRSLDHFMLDLPKRLTPLTITLHDPQERTLALRQLHTLKGNARSLGLMELAEAVHQVESSQLQDAPLTAALVHLRAVGQQYDQLFQSMFRGLSQTSSSLLALVDDIQPGIKQLLEKNHQPWGSITVEDEVGVWPADWQESLRVLLLHGLSNAVDHGYVLPHNPDAVRLVVEARRSPQGIRIYIRDRGCGIQWLKLQGLATERGFSPAPQRPLTDLLFADGISTSESVSLSSGRGMGLAAVKDACRDLGAEVTLLDNDEGQGTMLVVDIPSAKADVSVLSFKAGA